MAIEDPRVDDQPGLAPTDRADQSVTGGPVTGEPVTDNRLTGDTSAAETAEAVRQGPDWMGLVVAGALVAALAIFTSGWTVVIVASLIVMIFLHELGHYLTAKSAGMKVSEFFLGFGPRLWSFRRGETEYGLKAVPAGAYVRILGMSNLEEVDPADEERTYRSKPYWRRFSVAVAGSTMHFLLAFLLIFTVFAGFGIQKDSSHDWTVFVQPGSPAAAAGMKDGDRIVSLDGVPAGSFQDASDWIRAHPGESVTIVVDRDGGQQALTVDLADTHPGSTARAGYLGVGPDIHPARLGVLDAVGRSVGETRMAMWQSITGIGHLFSPHGLSQYYDNVRGDVGSGSAGTTASENRPTSVVGIVQVGAQVAKDGPVNVVYLLFFVNVFIGVFNLLPLLPFDGGHVVIATYEKVRSSIRGRAYHADVTKLMPLTYAVVALLGLIFVSSLYLDILHPVSIR
ncbi:MAG TPA: site-2 protease family protein [Acidimicrobiales bacterium]|jgi:membrane-associated protease RseP (regulator of RpoE activity)